MRSFAIIPACGRSVRMGTPKLLMPWKDSTVIEAVLAAWEQSQIDEIVVVVRRSSSLPHVFHCLCLCWHLVDLF